MVVIVALFGACLILGGICSIINIIICWVKGTGEVTPYVPTQHVDVHVHQYEQPQNPTIAEQFDGRLTNVFKNPLEGIL